MFDFTSLVQTLKLQASIWFALTIACGTIVFGPSVGLTFLNDTHEAVVGGSKLGLVLFGSLSLVSLLSAIWRAVLWCWGRVRRYWKRKDRRKAAINSLNDLSAVETEILSYLVTNGERHFNADIDGGRAASLVGRGLVVASVKRGQMVDMLSTPFSVDEDVWEALKARKEDFHHPNPKGRAPYAGGYF